MTVDQGSNLPALPSDYSGMDDFGQEDMVIPRITVRHKEGVFKDSLSNEEGNTLHAVVLGMVRQRILWHTQLGTDGEPPLCKSPDFQNGFPTPSDQLAKGKDFPWLQSGFRPEDYPADANTGLVMLPCSGCQLKEWGSHPLGNKPYCSETFTFPILYSFHEDGLKIPALFTTAKTGIRSAKAYLTGFKRMQLPPFTRTTRITLSQQTSGGNMYCVPQYQTLPDETNRDEWPEYGQAFMSIKEAITQAPISTDAEGNPEESNVRVAAGTPGAQRAPQPAPAPAPAAQSPAPAPTQAASTPVDDEDLPF